jgi:hypothetical protein
MTVTPLEHTAIGALGGSVEVVLMQPMMAFKNALQEGRPIPRNPIDMYRGLTVSGNIGSWKPQCSGMGSCTWCATPVKSFALMLTMVSAFAVEHHVNGPHHSLAVWDQPVHAADASRQT